MDSAKEARSLRPARMKSSPRPCQITRGSGVSSEGEEVGSAAAKAGTARSGRCIKCRIVGFLELCRVVR